MNQVVAWITNGSLYGLRRAEKKTVVVHRERTKVARIPVFIEQPAQQQEPVAAQSVMTVRIWRDKNSDQNAEFKNWHKLPDGEHILYTSPQAQPAQRTWVGLTDDERLECMDGTSHYALCLAIEAKLREKNA